MKMWKIGLVLCAGLGATLACDDDGDDNQGGAATGGGGAEGKGGAGKGGAGKGGAGKGGAGKGGGGGNENSAGEGGMTVQGGTSGGGEGGDGGMAGGAGGGEGGMGGEGGGDNGPPDPLAHCSDCVRSTIGSPKWEVTGVVAIPSDMPSFAGWTAFIDDLVGPNHASDPNDFVIGPALPHAGPYDHELYSLAIAQGITPKQTFTEAEFSDPSGVTIMMNLVPSEDAATGSSFDFDSGPIMPNALFPIAVDGDLLREGVIYDAEFDSSFPGYPAMNPPIAEDGPSHLVWFFGASSAFGPPATPATGSFEFELVITDSTGAGWNLTVPFTVTD